MKSISLCIKLHLPVIYHKQPFSEINIIDEFIDYFQTERHAKQLAEYRMLPFLKSINTLSGLFGERFKLAVSISGITVKILEKHAPFVLEEIRILSNKKVIEFFAEPWSNSILSYFIEKELVLQTELQRKKLQAVFGQLPTVFLASSALNPGLFSEFEPYSECKNLFTYSNQLYKKTTYQKLEEPLHPRITRFLINHKLSEKFQHYLSDNTLIDGSRLIAPYVRYLRKHLSLVKPLIINFNPLAKNISSYKKWETAISWFLENTNNSFYSLTDLQEIANYFSIENSYSPDMPSQFQLPDNWLKNNMQKESFKQLRNIFKIIKTSDIPYMPEAWEYLQDLNNFFYMSNSFFLEEFACQHFSPFRSPHEAFTSYMNAASNFWNVKKNSQTNIIKSNYLSIPYN